MRSSDLPDSLSKLLDRKCGGTLSLLTVWRISVGRLLSGGASEAAVARLVGLLRSPRNLESLATGLAQEGQELDVFLEGLMPLVDESIYALQEWIEAFECVQDSLTAQNRSASPSSIIGYVQCTAEFASHSEKCGTLPDLIRAMLDQYGFEGEEGCFTGATE